MRADVAPGGIFPNYELPDQTGQMRTLSELQGDCVALRVGIGALLLSPDEILERHLLSA